MKALAVYYFSKHIPFKKDSFYLPSVKIKIISFISYYFPVVSVTKLTTYSKLLIHYAMLNSNIETKPQLIRLNLLEIKFVCLQAMVNCILW